MPSAGVSADGGGVSFSCKDNSTAITHTNGTYKTAGKTLPALVVKCKSGAKLLVSSPANVKTVTVTYSCPGSEVAGIGVDVDGNTPSKAMSLYCVTATGADHPVTYDTQHRPTFKKSTVNKPAGGGDVGEVGGGDCKSLDQCSLMSDYVQPFINFLAALVGVVVVISIIVGGIQYSAAAGDPGKMTAARKRITNAIIALLVFFFLYAGLNFLIPGGLV